jgi:DNA anti-recombination protein RmuC
MTTLAAQWKAEGEAKSRTETVFETLETRFGTLNHARREKVRRMSTEELSRFNRRAITAPTVEDAFADDRDR